MKGNGGTRASLAGLAAGGVMAGHWAAYAIREPDAGARAVLLDMTGHHLLPQLAVVALLAAIAAIAALPFGAATGIARRGYATTSRRMVALQATAFLVLELGERTLAHGHVPPLEVVTDPAIGVGLVAQALIGCIAAALLVGLARLVVRPGAALTPSSVPVRWRPSPTTRLRPQRPGQDGHSLRGPPRFSRP